MRAPRDFDATLPKRRKRLPAEPRPGLLGFHLRGTCWRAEKIQPDSDIGKGGHIGFFFFFLDGISPERLLALSRHACHCQIGCNFDACPI